MNIKDPKTKGKHDATGNTDAHGKSHQQQGADLRDKKKAFDEGIPNNSNTQTGTAQSGYDEKNPKHPGGKQQQQPKVTNEENAITNSEEQNKLDEEPVNERSGNSAERTDPEIDSPIPDPERTEKKIPTMKGDSL